MMHLISILSVFLWGLSFIFSKDLVSIMSPIELSFYRYFLSGLLFLVISKDQVRIDNTDIKQMVLASILGVSIYSVLYNLSLLYLSSSAAGMINGTIPLITIFCERLFKGRRLTSRTMMSLLLSLSGIALMSLGNMGHSVTWIGILLMIVALFFWVLYTLINEKLLIKYSGTMLLSYQSIIGSLLLLPFILFKENSIEIQIGYFTNYSILFSIIFLAMIISGGGYLCYMYGLKHKGAKYMAFVMNLLPAVTLFYGVLIAKENLTIQQVMGMILVSGSIVFISERKPVLE